MSKPVFSNLFTFSGRRNRKSYFLYSLLVFVILTVVWVVGFVATGDDDDSVGIPIVVATIISVAIALSSWIVGAQRCRDFGWTGWSILITLIPIIGWLFPFVMLFVPGTAGPNRYGPDPLQAA
jgi:uncharacterized membrane protein YhaH (DUF805 family)